MTRSTLKNRLTQVEAAKLEAEALIIEDKIRELAPNLKGRGLRILGGLGPQISSIAFSVLSRWNRLDGLTGASDPRILYLNSGRGRFADCFAIYDLLRVSQADGGPDVTVQTTGLAGTQAAILMQAAKRRVMTPRSWLILTEIQPNPAHLNTSEGQEAVKYMKWLENRGWTLMIDRSSVTLEMLKENTEYGREWWINAEEALEMGLIDEIGTVTTPHHGYEHDESLAPATDDSWAVRRDKARLRMFQAETELATIGNTVTSADSDNAGKHYLFGEINTESCTAAQQDLSKFAQRDLPDVELIINSPGGSCFDGAGLMDVIDQTMADRDYTTTIFGECASMAGFIAQTGKRRVMARNAAFLIHRVSTMFGMSSSHMDDNTRNMERLEEMLFPFMAERTGGKLPLDELKERCHKADWWLTADEALERGLVDELI